MIKVKLLDTNFLQVQLPLTIKTTNEINFIFRLMVRCLWDGIWIVEWMDVCSKKTSNKLLIKSEAEMQKTKKKVGVKLTFRVVVWKKDIMVNT